MKKWALIIASILLLTQQSWGRAQTHSLQMDNNKCLICYKDPDLIKELSLPNQISLIEEEDQTTLILKQNQQVILSLVSPTSQATEFYSLGADQVSLSVDRKHLKITIQGESKVIIPFRVQKQ